MKTILAVVCLLATTALAEPACNLSLAAPRAYQQPAYDRVFTADFDGDGLLDAAFGTDLTFSIRYGLGGGKLTEPQVLPIQVFDVADVIGDALPDLIGPGIGIAASLGIHRNLGGREFAELFPVNGWTFVAADFTNDGRGDLLTFDTPYLQLYERAGNLLVSHGPQLQELDGEPRDFDAGDVNGDGLADLLVLSAGGGSVRVLTNGGEGVFTETRILRPDHPAVELEVADLRGDGRADVLTVSQVPESGYRARFETFPNAEPQSTATDVHNPDGIPSNLLVRDVTGDGRPDVLMHMTYPGIQPRIVVHVNEGGVLRRVNLSLFAPQRFPIEVGDFTGDRFPELVLPTANGFALITGKGDGTFSGSRSRREELRGRYYLTPSDLNGDGADDLVYMEPTTSSIGPLVVAMNDGAGNYTVTSILRSFHQGSTEVAVSQGDIVVIDKTFVNPQPVYIFRRNPAGEWVLARDYDTVANRALTHDLDGDGKNELILVEEEPLEGGPGIPTVSAKSLVVVSGKNNVRLFDMPIGAHLDAFLAGADMTGDGRPDLVVSTLGTSESGWYPPQSDGTVQLYAGRGDGAFFPPETIASNLSPGEPVIGDFNGDGRRDIAFTTWSGQLYAAYGDNDGVGTAARVSDDYVTSTVQAADLNGDGLTDLLTNADEELTIWNGTPAGLAHGDMYWTYGVPIRLRAGAPYSLIAASGIVDGECAVNRRRSIGRR